MPSQELATRSAAQDQDFIPFWLRHALPPCVISQSFRRCANQVKPVHAAPRCGTGTSMLRRDSGSSIGEGVLVTNGFHLFSSRTIHAFGGSRSNGAKTNDPLHVIVFIEFLQVPFKLPLSAQRTSQGMR